jgi:hypothetical protein
VTLTLNTGLFVAWHCLRYGTDSELNISCGADQSMLFVGDAVSNTTSADCATLAYALRFIAQQSLTPNSDAMRNAVCAAANGIITTNPPAPVAAPSRLTIFFYRNAEFDQMYDGSSPPALNDLREALSTTLATAAESQAPELAPLAARVEVLALIPSGRCIIEVHPPYPDDPTAADDDAADALKSALSSDLPFVFSGELRMNRSQCYCACKRDGKPLRSVANSSLR